MVATGIVFLVIHVVKKVIYMHIFFNIVAVANLCFWKWGKEGWDFFFTANP